MDFERAFVDGAAFEGPWGEGSLSVEEIAMLTLTSGQVVARDGLVCNPTPAFSQQVALGRYPVVLSIAGGTVAFAMLRFSDEAPVRWEMATTPGQDPAILTNDDIFGYPVDAGVGSFLDLDAQRVVEAMSEDDVEEMTDRLMAMMFPPDAEVPLWAEHSLDPTTGANQVIFSSGLGDDLYASFWGFAESGEPACLVTDFNMRLTVEGSMSGCTTPTMSRRPPWGYDIGGRTDGAGYYAPYWGYDAEGNGACLATDVHLIRASRT